MHERTRQADYNSSLPFPSALPRGTCNCALQPGHASSTSLPACRPACVQTGTPDTQQPWHSLRLCDDFEVLGVLLAKGHGVGATAQRPAAAAAVLVVLICRRRMEG